MITLQKIIRIALVVCMTHLSAVAIAQTGSAAPAKVVFQISDGDSAQWNLALSNAKNVQHELGASQVQIEFVVYGPGIGMVRDDAIAANRVTEAVQNGIQIVACENTMIGLKLTRADMNPSIGYVKAGVVELMKRQSEGWAYIRP